MASEDLISRAAGFAAAFAAMAAAGFATIPGHSLNKPAPAGVISVYVSSSDPVHNPASERVTSPENKPESNPTVLPFESYTKTGSGDTKTIPTGKPVDNSVKTVKAPPADLQNQKQDATLKKNNTANTTLSSDNSKAVPKTKAAAPDVKKEQPRKSAKNALQTKNSARENKAPVLRKRSATQKTQISEKQLSKSQNASLKAQVAPDHKESVRPSADHAAPAPTAGDLVSSSKPLSSSTATTTAKSRPSPGSDMVKLAVAKLRSEAKRRLVYPKAAIRRDLEGTVKVRFEIKDGRVRSASISDPSGEEILDENALNLALSLKGVQVMENGDLSVEIPVEYRLD